MLLLYYVILASSFFEPHLKLICVMLNIQVRLVYIFTSHDPYHSGKLKFLLTVRKTLLGFRKVIFGHLNHLKELSREFLNLLKHVRPSGKFELS